MNMIPQDDTPYKRCSNPDCHQWLPATPEFFSRDRSKKDELCIYCKGCETVRAKARYAVHHPDARPKRKSVNISEDMKYCSKCEQCLPATTEFYYKSKHMKDGFYAWCKVCDSARSKAYRESHQEQKQAYEKQRQPQRTERMRQYRQTEKNKAYRKQWQGQHYQEHKEEILERDKRYHEIHKEEVNARRRQFRKDHPEVLTGIDRAHKHKRRAQKKASKGNYTPQQLQEQYQRQKGKCYYCKTKVGKVWHADHVIPLNRGGSNDIHNIVVACPECNMHKHDKLPHEWPQGNRLL